jgi:hypothetical protein
MMDITKGYRTTEFWLSIAAFLVGVFVASGVLPSEHWGMKLSGALLSGLGVLGYGVSRGLAKLGGAAKALAPLALVGALLGGCTWQAAVKTSADVAGSLATSARAAGDPASVAECNARLVKCAEAKDGVCEPLKQCQADRHAFNAVLVGIQSARYGAYSAILVGNKKKAEGWVAALIDAGAKIEKALRALKVIP